MSKYLAEINLGYDPEKNKYYDWLKLAKRKNKDIEKYWLACKLSNNQGDNSKIKDLPYADLWTISFCCQDISVAGKMKGLKADSGTRSSLLWKNIELLNKSKEKGELPKYIMFENVKNLVSKKFIEDFNDLLAVMGELGFNSYWKVINAKDCGIAQNRERVFVICVRKDIDTQSFTFPKPFDNGLRLIDFLEDVVDEKYYLSKDVQSRFKITDKTFTKNIVGTTKPEFRTIGQRDLVYQQNSIMGALVATDYKQPKQIVTGRLKQVGQIYGTEVEPNPQAGRIYDAEYLSPTLDTCSGGNRMPKILEQNILNGAIRGRYSGDDNIEQKLEIGNGGNTNTLTTVQKDNIICELGENDFLIRKLTPKECYRLMGFTDDDINSAYAVGVADSQLYSQAGNSIVTNCVELLAEHLYKAQYDNTYVCKDENFTQPQEE